MITPVLDELVEYYAACGSVPQAALITAVWDDRNIAVSAFDINGFPSSIPAVRLLQDNDPIPASGPFCRWPSQRKA